MNQYIFLKKQHSYKYYYLYLKTIFKKTECTIFPNQTISNKIRIKPDKSNIKSIYWE